MTQTMTWALTSELNAQQISFAKKRAWDEQDREWVYIPLYVLLDGAREDYSRHERLESGWGGVPQFEPLRPADEVFRELWQNSKRNP